MTDAEQTLRQVQEAMTEIGRTLQELCDADRVDDSKLHHVTGQVQGMASMLNTMGYGTPEGR